MNTTTTTRITGTEAIDRAEAEGLTLAKFADPTEGAREGLTVAEARRIAREDEGLIYLDLAASVTVSMNNGATRTTLTTEAEALAFVGRYGAQNIVTEAKAAGLDPEGYDTALELLAALAETLPSGEVLALP